MLNKKLFFAAFIFHMQGLVCSGFAYAEPKSFEQAELVLDPSLTFEQRLDSVSSYFVGTSYRVSPLGEARGVDEDPLIRFDAFDCTTYVETIIALSQSTSSREYLTKLTQIRYSKGKVDFGNRRHLPEFQWLPELIEDFVLRDITEQVGLDETSFLIKSMSTAIWQQQSDPVIKHLDASHLPSKTIKLPYVPIEIFLRTAQQIQEIAVLSVVRANRENYPIVISHQALIIPSATGYRVRHARAKPVLQVVDEPLETFVARLQRNRAWPVLGLNITDIVE